MKVRVKGFGWERNVMTLVVDFEKEDKKRERAGIGEAIILLERKKTKRRKNERKGRRE